jgi:hypothetical protein
LTQLAWETNTFYLVLVGLAVGGLYGNSVEIDWWLTLIARFLLNSYLVMGDGLHENLE